MKKLMRFMVAGLCLVSGMAFGAEYTLKPDTTDWTKPDSYEPAGTPGPTDTIILPAETFEVDSSSASFATLSGVKRLVPEAATKLVITVGEGEATLGCAFNKGGETSGGATTGELVKRGQGTLKLGSPCRVLNTSGRACDYCARLTLEEGELSLMQEPAEFSNRSHYGLIATSNGTVLVASVLPAKTSSMWAEVEWMHICGTVTNEHATATRIFNVTGRASEGNSRIDGTVDGKIRFWATGNVDFNNAASTFSEGVTATGWTDETKFAAGLMQVLKFGNQNDAASALGTATSLTTHGGGGGFSYMGVESDVTDKSFSAFGGLFLDGGDFGGMTFSGKISNQRDSASNEGQHRFVLYGANASAPCVFNGTVVANDNFAGTSGKDYSFYVVKRGSGIWRFEGNKNGGYAGWNGGLAIEEGTFQFDSIAATGEDCSLGTALKLTDGHCGLWSDDHLVDYAVALGSASPAAPAVFEYVGATAASCSTRPIALVGQGGALRADSGALTYSGISARDAKAAPVLTLDGTSVKGNEVRNVSAGAEGAKVGIEKTGTGTWKVGGDFALGGDVRVREGTLSINVPRKPKDPVYQDFKWFRLSFAELANTSGTAAGSMFQIRQIGLFDKDGVRQNVGLKVPAANFDGETRTVRATFAKPGEAVYDPSMAGMTLTSVSGGDEANPLLQSCFSGAYSGYPQYAVGMPAIPDKTKPATWMKIVMHLPDTANPITHFDVQGFQDGCKNVPCRLVMEGSTDGRQWMTVYSNLEDEQPHDFTTDGYNPWISDGTKGAADNRPLPTAESPTGFLLSATGAVVSQEEPFSWFRLSVASIHNGANSLYIRNIHLFDKDGNRQNSGLVLPPGITAVSGEARTIEAVEIGPGEVYYDPSAAGLQVRPRVHSTGTVCDLPAAFNGSMTSDGVLYIEWLSANGSVQTPTPSNPKSWIPITMHLQPYASPVTHFDVMALYHDGSMFSGSKRVPTRMKLEGSCDGKTWTTVYSNVDDEEPLDEYLDGWNCWISDGEGSSIARPLSTAKLKLSSLYPEPESYDQHLDGFVEVASGARIETTEEFTIAKLRIDACGSGTLAGFEFPDAGTLDILNYARGMGVLPVTFENCTGIENLVNWSVRIDGTTKPAYKIEVTADGKVRLVPPGELLFVR